MKFRRNLKADVDINLTPLIDMVFLLLIFFMVTTTFNRDSRLLINLPEAKGELLEQSDLRLEVLITREGKYRVNGRELGDTTVETLKQALTALAAGDKNVPITITADAETTHQSVVTAMDAVAQLGFSKLNIATRQSEAAAQ
jgi:biopolymer transport protein ExbD